MASLDQTTLIIIFTAVVSFLAWQNEEMLRRLLFRPSMIQRGEIERFLTHGFIHADPMHLLFNMFTLYFFGSILEPFYRQYLGGAGYLVFYLGAIVVAILPSYFQHKKDPMYASLGASGAVSAVLFAFILFAPWEMIYLFAAIPVPAIVFAVLYVVFSLKAQFAARDNINHSAHLYGALYGVVVTMILEPRVIKLFFMQLINPFG